MVEFIKRKYVKIENKYKVYLATFSDGMVYVGITGKSIFKRYLGHQSKKTKSRMANAVQDYGLNSIRVSILERLPTMKDARSREKYWIEFYKSSDKTKGYNDTKGG